MNAIIRQKRPIASDKANPMIAYENSCCLRDGFLAYPITKLPNTVPIPAPEIEKESMLFFFNSTEHFLIA